MGIKALGYVIIATQKMQEWDDYLLNVVGVMKADDRSGGAATYRIDDRPFRIWVEEGGQEKFLAAAYEVGSASQLDNLQKAIKASGQPVERGSKREAKDRCVEAFFKTIDPAGNGLEFFHGDSRDSAKFVSPVGVSGFVTGDMGMGHAVLATPNFSECHDFYKNVVGFHDTDIPRFKFSEDPNDPGMGFAFMHADNGRHHSIALGEMPMPPSACIHIMLELKTMSDVGKCYDRMRLAKVPVSATLGRHVNDQTTGFYMQTPSGFDLEIGCDPLVIDPKNWEPTAHLQPSEWGHVWAWQAAMEEEQS